MPLQYEAILRRIIHKIHDRQQSPPNAAPAILYGIQGSTFGGKGCKLRTNTKEMSIYC